VEIVPHQAVPMHVPQHDRRGERKDQANEH